MSFVRNWLAGEQMGRERLAQQQAEQQRNQLAQLSSAALAAPMGQRQAFASQIAAIDPNAGFAFAENVAAQEKAEEAARQARVGNMARLLSVAPPQTRGGLYARMRPELAGMGVELPEQWDDTLLPMVQSLGGQQEGAQSAQRAYVEWMASKIPEEERGEFFRVQAGLEPKKQNQQFAIKEVENADGTVSFVPVATRGGNVAGGAPAGAAPRPASIGAPNMDSILAQANILAQQGVPDAQIEQFIAQSAQRAGVQMTPAADMNARANATLDAQTYGGGVAPAPAVGQATNATRAAAAAEAAAAKVRAEESARASVKREIDAPKVIEEGERLIGYINAIIDDPNRELVTGGSGVFNPMAWPGIDRISGAADTKLRVAQVQGNAFLQAFESLKGGGAITEIEGQKAEQAIARLSTAQSDEGFLLALKDFRDAIQPGIERARRRAAGGQTPAAQQQARPRAQSADGRVVEWDGSAWVEVI